MASCQPPSQITQPMGAAAQGRQVAEPIAATEEYMRYLTKLIPSQTKLVKAGFVVKPLTKAEIQAKVKCQRCNKKCNKKDNKKDWRRGKGSSNAATATGGSSGGGTSSNGQGAGAANGHGAAVTNLNGGSSNSHHDGKKRYRSHVKPNQQDKGKQTDAAKGKQPKVEGPIICKFHPGRVNNKIWTCCSKHVSQPPCSGAPSHTPTIHAPGVLENRWRFVPTPSTPPLPSPSRTPQPQPQPSAKLPPPSTRFANFHSSQRPTAQSPQSPPSQPPAQSQSQPQITPGHRPAVSLDCEMGLTTTFESELIRLSLIDYFTGQILLDTLVHPTVPMQHMNTKYSGVTRSDLNRAVQSGTCIMGGFVAAREEVWKFVGPETVVVGHGVGNDLGCLRWVHNKVVDSLIIEEGVRRELREEEGRERKRMMGRMFEGGMGVEEVRAWAEEKEKEEREREKEKRAEDGMSLKALAKKKLGRAIQDGGKRGHDSVEDAVAARDLVNLVVEGMMRRDREGREGEEKEAAKKAEEEKAKKAEEEAAAKRTQGQGGGMIIAEIATPFVVS